MTDIGVCYMHTCKQTHTDTATVGQTEYLLKIWRGAVRQGKNSCTEPCNWSGRVGLEEEKGGRGRERGRRRERGRKGGREREREKGREGEGEREGRRGGKREVRGGRETMNECMMVTTIIIPVEMQDTV